MPRFALSSAFALALAACGPVAEESDDPGSEPTPPASPVVTPPAAEGEVPFAGAPPPAFAQCAVCHKVQRGQRGIGPSLAGVFQAPAAHVGDYAYSAAMRRSGLTWDEPTLDRYLESPLKVVPGTKMAFAGLKDPAQRQAVIAYLKTL